MPGLVERGLRVIDLGADYRLTTRPDYQRWYDFEHPAPALLARAVYGLPEHGAAASGARGAEPALSDFTTTSLATDAAIRHYDIAAGRYAILRNFPEGASGGTFTAWLRCIDRNRFFDQAFHPAMTAT